MIQKRGSRWRVVVQAGPDPLTGKRRQLGGSASTRQDALQVERRLMTAAAGGLPGQVTLSEVVDEFWAAGPRLAPTTRLNYRSNLELHVLPLHGSGPLALR